MIELITAKHFTKTIIARKEKMSSTPENNRSGQANAPRRIPTGPPIKAKARPGGPPPMKPRPRESAASPPPAPQPVRPKPRVMPGPPPNLVARQKAQAENASSVTRPQGNTNAIPVRPKPRVMPGPPPNLAARQRAVAPGEAINANNFFEYHYQAIERLTATDKERVELFKPLVRRMLNEGFRNGNCRREFIRWLQKELERYGK